jgi:hypothetical protein
MTAKDPLAVEAAWKTTPIVVTVPVPMRHHRRPNFSVSQEVKKQARKHPAWRVETMFWSSVTLAAGV